MAEGYSPFQLMYGVRPRMHNADPPPFITSASPANRMTELQATTIGRASRVDRQPLRRDEGRYGHRFAV